MDRCALQNPLILLGILQREKPGDRLQGNLEGGAELAWGLDTKSRSSRIGTR